MEMTGNERNSLAYVNIYPESITDFIDTCEGAMRELGFTLDEIDCMNEYAYITLNQLGTFKQITNSIIDAYGYATSEFIMRKYPQKEVDYYVNGLDSHLYIDGEEW